MRIALLIFSVLAVSVAVPTTVHAQGAVPPDISYYSSAQFTDVACPRTVGSNTEPALGLLSFEANGAFRCKASGKDQFVIPYNAVRELVFEKRVREPQSGLSRYKVCRSHRLTIVYTDEQGRPRKTAVWLASPDWSLALAVAASKTGLPVQRDQRSEFEW